MMRERRGDFGGDSTEEEEGTGGGGGREETVAVVVKSDCCEIQGPYGHLQLGFTQKKEGRFFSRSILSFLPFWN